MLVLVSAARFLTCFMTESASALGWSNKNQKFPCETDQRNRIETLSRLYGVEHILGKLMGTLFSCVFASSEYHTQDNVLTAGEHEAIFFS